MIRLESGLHVLEQALELADTNVRLDEPVPDRLEMEDRLAKLIPVRQVTLRGLPGRTCNAGFLCGRQQLAATARGGEYLRSLRYPLRYDAIEAGVGGAATVDRRIAVQRQARSGLINEIQF